MDGIAGHSPWHLVAQLPAAVQTSPAVVAACSREWSGRPAGWPLLLCPGEHEGLQMSPHLAGFPSIQRGRPAGQQGSPAGRPVPGAADAGTWRLGNSLAPEGTPPAPPCLILPQGTENKDKRLYQGTCGYQYLKLSILLTYLSNIIQKD